MKLRVGRMISAFLFSAMSVSLTSGAALATCSPAAATGVVPCYMKVQPIDVGTSSTGPFAPFNTVFPTGGLPDGSATVAGAGMPLQSVTLGTSTTAIPNNSTSPNPIGFVVDPTGLTPDQLGYVGHDVTRALLNNIGVELVWLPMTKYITSPTQNLTTLNVDLAPTGSTVASCTGYISNTTLTISACSTTEGMQPLAVYDFLFSTQATIQPNTYITALGTGSGGIGTYTVTPSQTAGGSGRKQITITAQSFTLTSSDFKTLSDQPAISQGGVPSPAPPLSSDPTTVNLFFVNKLNPPPALGGTLYGFGWLCNNGVAIGASTFAQPARPDTIAHELLHNLCLDHTTYGAGPWTAPTNNGSYTSPAGVVPTIPNTPFPGQCDPNYPACGANLMTTGSLRTEPTLKCILAPPGTAACLDASGNQLPGLFSTTKADQVTSSPVQQNGVTLLPVPQETQVLGRSGLLFTNNPTLQFSGLLDPIPQETTKAQLGTDGSPNGRAIFDLSAPTGGKPGETLLAWVLTLPQEQSFGRRGVDILSQSRKDLVQDVQYYPGPGNNPRKRNIAYQPNGDNNADDQDIAAAGPSPCASVAAKCLVLKFQPPGLGADDSISFSNVILSGDASITNEDLCKAKVTYIFSDGFVTTSNFGNCQPVSLPLIANSWHPDPYVAPHVVKSNLLLAQIAGPTQGCTPDASGSCPPLEARDHDVTQEAQSQSCDNGATSGSDVTGIINKNVIITGGQTCRYRNCEFKASLTINNAHAFLQNCQIDGNLTMNSGTLNLAPTLDPTVTSVRVIGNVQIGSNDSLPNGFSIGPNVSIGGNLTIQNLPNSEQPGYVCGSQLLGGLTVNNDQSHLFIGQALPPAPICPGNTIAGGLLCNGTDPNLIGGGNNLVSGRLSTQCSFLLQP